MSTVACVVCGESFESDLGAVLAEAGVPVTCSLDCTEKLPGHEDYVRAIGPERWAAMKRQLDPTLA